MKKVSPLSFLAISFLVSCMLLSSCSKDSPSEIMTILDGRDHIITYNFDDTHINLTIDAIRDTTNAIEGTWPDLDVVGVYVDKNNNGILDPNIDFILGFTEGNQTCHATLTSETTSSGCSFFDDFTGGVIFGPTENNTQDHVSFNLSIPKRFFSNESKANFYLRLLDSDTGQVYLPSSPPSFATTFEITW